jgi:ABC-2 type transport system permease protein
MARPIAHVAQVLSLIRKEMLALVKDPANRALLFMPAIMQALLFGYGATYDLTHASYAILDQSRGAASTELLARLDGTGVFRRTATLTSSDQIAAQIDSGEALLVISIPPDFAARLASGQEAPLQLILDGRNSSTAGLASAYVGAIVAAYNQSLGNAPPITIQRRAWFNPNLESRWNIMPALIAALSMLQTLMLSALSVAREREQGTFDQLLVTPLTPSQILIGKALPSMLVGILQSTLIFLIILFWFRIPMAGSVWLLYLGLAMFTLASVGIGLSISAVSLTMQQAMLYTFMLVMPLMLLSGLLTPVRNMPTILQAVTYANPLRFGVDLVRRVYLEGATLADVAFNFVPLLAVAAVTLPLAAWLFRHRLA